jgi:hypothetical protein
MVTVMTKPFPSLNVCDVAGGVIEELGLLIEKSLHVTASA